MTKTIRTMGVIFVVLVQMGFFIAWYSNESGAFEKPLTKIMVRTVPYDPRDFLSGQYLRLSYSFSRPFDEKGKTLAWGKEVSKVSPKTPVWLVLHEVSRFYEPKKASLKRPQVLKAGEVLIKGHVLSSWNREIIYGLEKYFVPEGTKEPDPKATTVELSIYKGGRARIHKVFVNGKEWP